MSAISSVINKITGLFTIINFPADIIDIAIVTLIIYYVLKLTRSRTASQIIKVVLLLFVVSYLSSEFELNVLNFLTSWVLEAGLIALVVVFQPELRRLLEKLGGTSVKNFFVPKQQMSDMHPVIEATVEACTTMSRQRIGALIVFERENDLEEYFKTGTIVDAAYSTEILKNIFFPKAALHDGAVVVRGDRVMAAGCVLPLTENPNLSRELGTRHRAAIGISEHSDSVVVVVSEESGIISVVVGGVLKRYLTPEALSKFLTAELVVEEQLPAHHKLREKLATMLKNKEGDSHEAE